MAEQERPPLDLHQFLQRPHAGGGTRESAPDTVIPLAPRYKLTNTELDLVRETARRHELLTSVTVDENGIAHVAGVRLAAVRITNHDARQVPFTIGEGAIELPLPADEGSQIGFFIGHTDTTDDGRIGLSAVLRQGAYPGIPLLTAEEEDGKGSFQGEAILGLNGIKPKEIDEQKWAEQIDLVQYGFVPEQTRGMFSSKSKALAENFVRNRRLVVTPERLRDVVQHHDSFIVTEDLIQIGVYPAYRPTHSPNFSRHMYPTTAAYGLGLGFGNEYRQDTSNMQKNKTGELHSAFQIRIVPQEK